MFVAWTPASPPSNSRRHFRGQPRRRPCWSKGSSDEQTTLSSATSTVQTLQMQNAAELSSPSGISIRQPEVSQKRRSLAS